jgi:hypothetical protein
LKQPSILTQLEEARALLTESERELQQAIGALRSSPRSSKVTAGALLEAAFEKLHAAKATVIALQDQLVGSDGPAR